MLARYGAYTRCCKSERVPVENISLRSKGSSISSTLTRCMRQVKPEEVELVRRDYTANSGWETFLAYEDPRQDILVGLVRLRKVTGSDKDRQPQLLGACSIIRELHVYGTAVAVHSRDSSKHQHQVWPSDQSNHLHSHVVAVDLVLTLVALHAACVVCEISRYPYCQHRPPLWCHALSDGVGNGWNTTSFAFGMHGRETKLALLVCVWI